MSSKMVNTKYLDRTLVFLSTEMCSEFLHPRYHKVLETLCFQVVRLCVLASQQSLAARYFMTLVGGVSNGVAWQCIVNCYRF